MLSGVTILTKSLKISDTSKKAFMGLIFFESYQKISQKQCRADLSSVLDTSTCWLSISVLIGFFLGFSVTPFFPGYNFSKKSLWGSNFFWKDSKFYLYCGSAEKNGEKFFWVVDYCIWIGCVKRSILLREYTCYRVSIC